jgi:hypothetical protein
MDCTEIFNLEIKTIDPTLKECVGGMNSLISVFTGLETSIDLGLG